MKPLSPLILTLAVAASATCVVIPGAGRAVKADTVSYVDSVGAKPQNYLVLLRWDALSCKPDTTQPKKK